MNPSDEIRLAEAKARVLLSGPANLTTCWIVITGAPSSGKSSVLRLLEREGCRVAVDIARREIERERSLHGTSPWKVREDEVAFQERVLWKMIAEASEFSRDTRVFFDYGLPDNIVFWELSGLKVRKEVWQSARLFRYQHVFLFESLPFISDSVRIEDAEYQTQFVKCARKIYAQLGYRPVWVPSQSVESRALLIKRIITPR